MDLLIFERKPGISKYYKKPVLETVLRYCGILQGEQVIVENISEARDLYNNAFFGEFLQRRAPRVSVECFEGEINNEIQQYLEEKCSPSQKREDDEESDEEDPRNIYSRVYLGQTKRFVFISF
ncbi:unnamed protein product [Thelazia callipaeda]|uniref:tRNA_int_endo_N domain-containing protein n=1 Tax=Thelazia callipaeda TaxID=103827 RepID=A0A0N5CZP2_THECL|nr:unnamed protein product [Thelazia callipaeda]